MNRSIHLSLPVTYQCPAMKLDDLGEFCGSKNTISYPVGELVIPDTVVSCESNAGTRWLRFYIEEYYGSFSPRMSWLLA